MAAQREHNVNKSVLATVHSVYESLITEAAFARFPQDGSLSYPPDGSDFKYLLELRAEAEYYGLTGMLENIDRYPVS